MPGGRVQKDEPLHAAFERLTKLSWGYVYRCPLRSFTVSGSTSMTTTFRERFQTHYIVLGFRLRVSENDLQLPDLQHDAYRWLAIEEIWPVTMCTTTAGLLLVRRVRPEHPGYEDPCVWHQLFAGVDRYR
ncbi:NUDIX domain-containing protein [Shigella flexneri]